MFINSIDETLQNLYVINIETNSKIIDDLISTHSVRAAKMKLLYEQYKGKTPILGREFDDPTKLNNQLVVDYRGDITDTVTGYLYGHPISRQINKTKYSESDYNLITNNLENFLITNNMEDIDSEVGKFQSICGYGVKLLYINNDGEEACTIIKPWEALFIDDGSVGSPQVAIRYYDFTKNGKAYIKVEMYDKDKVMEFEKQKDEKFYVQTAEYPHLFGDVPLIKYKNNDEEMGDFEKVESLINSYEKVVSDVQNEAEELRLAYMLFYGVEATTEVMLKARKTGGFTLDAGNDEKVEFLTKDINIEFIENHKKTLNDLIYKHSKVVDMSDESFSGAQSGVSRRWKLQGLENKCVTKERKFNSGDRQMFKCLQTPWNTKNVPFNHIDLSNQFTRNLPADLTDEVEMVRKMGINVSQKTLLSLLSFVKDVDRELETYEQEKAAKVVTTKPVEYVDKNTENITITEV